MSSRGPSGRCRAGAALDLLIPCGGWCPKGRKAEDGPIHARYPLTETPTIAYSQRTKWNIRDADGTLILTWGKPTGGTLLTVRECRSSGKPYLVIDLAGEGERAAAARAVRCWITEKLAGRAGAGVLNVAGPRASKNPAVYDRARAFLRVVLADGL